MRFDLWFPTAILYDNINNAEINTKLLERITEIKQSIPSGGSNWLGKPYNTCGTFDISKDPAFNDVLQEITKRVRHCANRLGVDVSRHPYQAKEGWLNIYQQNDFQEYHYHAGFHFSAVYYVKVPENSSEIIFESPLPPDMDPIPVNLHSHLTDQRTRYHVTAGDIVVFRSNLRHCVPAHQGTDERISLAFNFR